MTEPRDIPVRRWRWRRMIGGGVALGLAGVAAGWLLEPRRPALIAGLPDFDARGNAELAGRIARQYPVGTPVAAMADALARDGFAVGDGLARWDETGFPCRTIASVHWRARAGRVVSTDAGIAQVCT